MIPIPAPDRRSHTTIYPQGVLRVVRIWEHIYRIDLSHTATGHSYVKLYDTLSHVVHSLTDTDDLSKITGLLARHHIPLMDFRRKFGYHQCIFLDDLERARYVSMTLSPYHHIDFKWSPEGTLDNPHLPVITVCEIQYIGPNIKFTTSTLQYDKTTGTLYGKFECDYPGLLGWDRIVERDTDYAKVHSVNQMTGHVIEIF